MGHAGGVVNDDDSFPWARLDRNLLQCWVMQGRCPPPDDQHAAPDAIYAEVSPLCTCASELLSLIICTCAALCILLMGTRLSDGFF